MFIFVKTEIDSESLHTKPKNITPPKDLILTQRHYLLYIYLSNIVFLIYRKIKANLSNFVSDDTYRMKNYLAPKLSKSI